MSTRQKTTFIILILIISLCSITILAETEEKFQIKTIKGEVRAFGTEPQVIYTLKTNEGDTFILWEGLIKQISKLKQFELLVTGKVFDNIMISLDYDVVSNIEDMSIFIGQVYSNGQEIFLLTKEQEVIKINKGLTTNEANSKCLVRGNYTSTGDYEGEMDVIDFIVIN